MISHFFTRPFFALILDSMTSSGIEPEFTP